MSFSMSPPAQKPQPPYSPYSASGSPSNNQSPYAPPPAKRPRLSPDAKSPNGTSPSPYGNSPHGLPMQYGNPYAQQGVQSPYSPGSFAGSPQGSFNTPQPYQPNQQQMPWNNYSPAQPKPSQASPPPANSNRDMPPPPRPNKDDRDEKAGIDDINDSLFMSGINLKDEENYLHNTYNNRHVNDSFATNQSTSFGSSTVGSNNSFNMLTQGTSFGSQGADGGRMQVRSQEQLENEAKRKREQAARARAEKEQHHLNNQFLLGNCVRNRMHKLATDNAVRVDVQGVYVRNPEQTETKVLLNGDGTEGVAAVTAKPEAMIEAGVPYEHILSLISLAAGERLRGLVDDAYGLARARRFGDHGRVVPPEFAEIAVGEGKKSQETVVPESITGTQWDEPRDAAAGNVNGETQTNGDKATPQPLETVAFQGTLNARLRELAERDKQAEKERQKKRESRKRKAENAPGDETAPAATTPAEIPAAGPIEAAPPTKTSKKDAKKQKEAQTAETQSFNQSNRTAAMMAMGGKRKTYSWMNGGASNLPTNRFAKPAGGSGTATPKAQEPAAAAAAKKEEVKIPTWGDWREDSVDGKGIQLRDWVLVLERDGREKKALQKAVNKLS